MFADVSGDGEIDTAEFVEWLTADTKPSSAITGTAAESAVVLVTCCHSISRRLCEVACRLVVLSYGVVRSYYVMAFSAVVAVSNASSHFDAGVHFVDEVDLP